MECKLLPLFSSSTGNCTLVVLGETKILVDAGVSAKQITLKMKQAGIDPKELSAIVVTHSHSDHTAGIRVLSKQNDLPVYATQGTWDGISVKNTPEKESSVRVITTGEDFYIDDVNVLPFPIPHDTKDPCGYAFSCRGARVCVATDVGCIRDSWLCPLEGADAVLLESNHDVEMLKAGPYEYDLKKRILSKKGHLSNDDAGKAAVRLSQSGVKTIVLGHLSETNNIPEIAYLTVKNALDEAGETDVALSVAAPR